MFIRPAGTRRVEQNRLFAAGMLLVVVLNGLFALVYTLRVTSSFAAQAWNVTSLGGFAFVLAVLVGAYYSTYHDQRPGLGLMLAMAAIFSQLHIFYTQPALWGGQGWLYYLVNAAAVTVVVYDRLLQRENKRAALASVVSLEDRRSDSARNAA